MSTQSIKTWNRQDARRISRAGRWWLQRPGTIISVLALAVVLFGVTIGTVIYPHDPNFQVLQDRYLAPSAEHPLGTDGLGRDLLARVLEGAGVSLMAAFLSMALALVIGTPLGLLAGYIGRLADGILSRVFDALQVIPGLILLVALVGALGRDIRSVILGLGILYSVKIFRVTRAVTKSIGSEVYVEAATAAGGSTGHILFRHILVNALQPLIVQVTILIAWGVLAETGLTFLGLGAQPPAASLGSLLAEGTQSMAVSPWLIIAPGLVIGAVVLSLFTLSDSISELVGGKERG